jgi:hypothetical protein
LDLMQPLRVAALAAASAVLVLALLGGVRASAAGGADGERIVGGQQTTIDEWPWQVAIARNPDLYGGDGYDRQFCGGTLVAPQVVVSAGHCFHDIFDNDGEFDDPTNFSVITGRTTLSSSAGQEIDVADYFVATAGPDFESVSPTPPPDPLFDPGTLEWDVVFAELAVNSVSPSAPIKVAGPGETALWEPGRTAYITGWGNTQDPFVGYPDDLHEAEIHMIGDAFCGSATAYGSEFDPETMVCAGEELGGRDTCQGDSGGPLVVPVAGGGFRLVGDTSWGFGCALPNFPGIYGRLADDPIRTALASAIQAEFGVDVLGSGGVPPPVTSPATVPPPVTTPVTADTDCQQARAELRQAKQKLRKAKKRLERAKRTDASRPEIKRAKRKVARARNAVRRKKQKVERECG